MANLDDLIKYENEHSGLDFKAIQYTREKYGDFIKDIMSMANSDMGEEGYIIIGVKLKNSSERDILGIDKDDFIDSATYQQIINENIEPDINIEYTSYLFESKYLGILKISHCNDQPYMMKKDFGKLKKGDCFIRKGSFQPKMTRQDFDRIITERMNSNKFNGEVKVYFSGSSKNQEITLPTAQDIELPSIREADKLRKLIREEKKKQLLPDECSISEPNINNIPLISSFLTSDAGRRIAALENALKNVKKEYRDDDYYEFFELRSHKLNITIMNEGDAYIEDASLKIDVNKIDGLVIPEKIYEKPKESSIFEPRIANLDFGRYPKVEDKGSFIRIHNSSMVGRLGKWDIKHQIPEEAFLEPVRFLLSKNLAGQVIQLKCKLYGKNLKDPFETILKIRVIPNDTLHKE